MLQRRAFLLQTPIRAQNTTMSPECHHDLGRKVGQTATHEGIRGRIEETKAWRLRRTQSPRRTSIAGPDALVIDPNTWVSTTRLVEDTARLCSRLPGDIDAVLGIARSGLLPATQIAVMLHRPLYSVGTFETDPAQIQHCGGGWRMLGTLPHASLAAPKKLLIADDTARHGIAMERVVRLAARKWPDAQILTAVIYAHPQTLHLLDYVACSYDGPHYLEWNLFNTSHMDPAVGGGLVSDLDGILCPDIASKDDDDGPRYLAAVRNALPIQRPNRRPIPVIVTARLEKYRTETEVWLRRAGIRWQRLIMGPWKTLQQRNQGWPENVVRVKSEAYLASGFNLFVESEPFLARRICERTRRPVLCPQHGRVLTHKGE
jgi:hypoxanthine phosphoribosyltransferase